MSVQLQKQRSPAARRPTSQVGNRNNADYLKKGTWSPEEDALLMAFVTKHGPSAWNMARSHFPGLRRTGKSCRLRYLNQLRPGIRRSSVGPQEERQIMQLHFIYGNQWSKIASMLPGRTDNCVKNVVNMRLKKARRRAASLNMARMLLPLAGVLNLDNFNNGPLTEMSSSLDTLQATDQSASILSAMMPCPSAASEAAAQVGGQLPSVQIPCTSRLPSVPIALQNLSLCSHELPSVQYNPINTSISNNGPCSALKLQTQPISFDIDMSEIAASFACFNTAPAGDVDLLEAVYASGYVSSDSSTLSGSQSSSSRAAGNRGHVIDDSCLSAILGRCEAISSSAIASLPLLLNQGMEMGMEYSHESVGPAEGEEGVGNSTGILERLNAMMGGELNSLILGSTWDSMPGTSHVGDLEFE